MHGEPHIRYKWLLWLTATPPLFYLLDHWKTTALICWVKQIGLQPRMQADPVYKVRCFSYVTGDRQSPKKEEWLAINGCVLSLGELARLIPEFVSCRDPCSHQGLCLTPGAGVRGRGLLWYVGRRDADISWKNRSCTLIEGTSWSSRRLDVDLVSCLLENNSGLGITLYSDKRSLRDLTIKLWKDFPNFLPTDE